MGKLYNVELSHLQAGNESQPLVVPFKELLTEKSKLKTHIPNGTK